MKNWVFGLRTRLAWRSLGFIGPFLLGLQRDIQRASDCIIAARDYLGLDSLGSLGSIMGQSPERIIQFRGRSIPPEERDAAWGCLNSLHDLRRFRESVHSAVQLFDFCQLQIHETSMPLGREGPYREWMRIAGRDAGISIFGFAKSMEAANTWAHKSPYIIAQLNRDKLRKARRHFKEKFPAFIAVRHAIAHSGEIAKNEKAKSEHEISTDSELKITDSTGKISLVEAPGGLKGLIVTDSFLGRTFTTTWEGEIQQYDLSQATVDSLHATEEMFISAFDLLLW